MNIAHFIFISDLLVSTWCKILKKYIHVISKSNQKRKTIWLRKVVKRLLFLAHIMVIVRYIGEIRLHHCQSEKNPELSLEPPHLVSADD